MNRGKDKDKVEISLEHDCKKPLRKYVYEANNIPYNDFCDLQAHSGKISAKRGNIKITLPPESVIFLTTDYTDRKPSEILSLKKKGKTLSWKKCEDAEHCYYRVFASDKEDFIPSYENQIASTVAECITLKKNMPFYKVLSVDRCEFAFDDGEWESETDSLLVSDNGRSRFFKNMLSKGEHTLDITVFGTRGNAFGAVHNTKLEEEHYWYGPGAWRTHDEPEWSDAYVLKKTGLIDTPIIF